MFQRIAHCRLDEARVLFAAKQYSGAYYLAGYVVECALKAAICRQFQRHTLPSKKLVFDSFDHDLEKLVTIVGLKGEHDSTRKAGLNFDLNWSIIKDWKPESRYSTHAKIDAQEIIEAVGAGPSSFIELGTETMVRSLAGDEVQAGRSIARRLNETIPVSVALWNYESDHERWRLILGVSQVDRSGKREVLKEVQTILAATKLTLDDVRVLGMRESLPAVVGKYLPHQQEGEYPEIDGVTLGDYDLRRAIVIWTQRPLSREELAHQEELRQRSSSSKVATV